jgi:hypothetical protein
MHASHAAIYYDYVVMSVTEFCFLLPQDIIVEPNVKHIPEVLFMSSALPAQSESINS